MQATANYKKDLLVQTGEYTSSDTSRAEMQYVVEGSETSVSTTRTMLGTRELSSSSRKVKGSSSSNKEASGSNKNAGAKDQQSTGEASSSLAALPTSDSEQPVAASVTVTPTTSIPAATSPPNTQLDQELSDPFATTSTPASNEVFDKENLAIKEDPATTTGQAAATSSALSDTTEPVAVTDKASNPATALTSELEASSSAGSKKSKSKLGDSSTQEMSVAPSSGALKLTQQTVGNSEFKDHDAQTTKTRSDDDVEQSSKTNVARLDNNNRAHENTSTNTELDSTTIEKQTTSPPNTQTDQNDDSNSEQGSQDITSNGQGNGHAADGEPGNKTKSEAATDSEAKGDTSAGKSNGAGNGQGNGHAADGEPGNKTKSEAATDSEVKGDTSAGKSNGAGNGQGNGHAADGEPGNKTKSEAATDSEAKGDTSAGKSNGAGNGHAADGEPGNKTKSEAATDSEAKGDTSAGKSNGAGNGQGNGHAADGEPGNKTKSEAATDSEAKGDTSAGKSNGADNGQGNGHAADGEPGNKTKSEAATDSEAKGDTSAGKSNGAGNGQGNGHAADGEPGNKTKSEAATDSEAKGDTSAGKSNGAASASSEKNVHLLRGAFMTTETSIPADLSPVLRFPEAGSKSTSHVPYSVPTDSQRDVNEDGFTSSKKPFVSEILDLDTSNISPGNRAVASSASSKQTSDIDSANNDVSGNENQIQKAKTEAFAIQTMDAATQDARQYVRGDPMVGDIEGGGSSIFEEGGGGSSPLVIGGRKRGWQTQAKSGLYAASSSFHNALRFAVCAAALVSVILMTVFHFEVLNDGLSRYFPRESLWTPNAWEFVLYTQYIQQVAGISALTLLKTPYFLWDFTDLFAWTNFLVYRVQDASSSGSGRRLTTIILGGLVGYGDRIGTSEMDLMYQTCTGFVCVLGFFLGIVLGARLFNKWRQREGGPGNSGVVWRCLGLVALVWFFCLLPLTMMVSFEVSMEFKAQDLELWRLSIAFAVVVLGIFGVIVVAARTILHSSEHDLQKLRARAVWGAFYSNCTYGGRLFFLLTVAQQICMGLCIGILDDSMVILVLLVVLHVVFLVSIFVAKPFSVESEHVKRATVMVTTVKLTNLALAFAFLPSSTLSVAGLFHIANIFIAVNALVIIIWCFRHLVIFVKLAVASAKQDVESRDTEVAIDASPSISVRYESVSKLQ
ncbi:hypothetical protein PRIC1_002253 [Phytophthora ramorum]